MKHRVERRDDGRWQLELVQDDDRIQTLTSGEPPPDALAEGDWLVLLFAVWSQADRKAVEIAIDDPSWIPSPAQLLLVPFEDPTEIAQWTPDASGRTPRWLWFKDGQRVDEHVGPVDLRSLAARTQSLCA